LSARAATCGGAPSSAWLDGAVRSLGATSVLAVVLSPVPVSATVGAGSLAKAVAVANPLLDLLLVAIAAIAAWGTYAWAAAAACWAQAS